VEDGESEALVLGEPVFVPEPDWLTEKECVEDGDGLRCVRVVDKSAVRDVVLLSDSVALRDLDAEDDAVSDCVSEAEPEWVPLADQDIEADGLRDPEVVSEGVRDAENDVVGENEALSVESSGGAHFIVEYEVVLGHLQAYRQEPATVAANCVFGFMESSVASQLSGHVVLAAVTERYRQGKFELPYEVTVAPARVSHPTVNADVESMVIDDVDRHVPNVPPDSGKEFSLNVSSEPEAIDRTSPAPSVSPWVTTFGVDRVLTRTASWLPAMTEITGLVPSISIGYGLRPFATIVIASKRSIDVCIAKTLVLVRRTPEVVPALGASEEVVTPYDPPTAAKREWPRMVMVVVDRKTPWVLASDVANEVMVGDDTTKALLDATVTDVGDPKR
jgi:hypothetical protein